MAECFCGCGRKLGFGNRGMNRNGRATASLVEQLEATKAVIEQRGPLTPGGDNAEMLESYERKIERGIEFREAWLDALHNGPGDIPPRNALAFKREWSAWGKDAKDSDSLARKLLALSPEQMDDFLRQIDAGP
jgi:hypothetical protein